MEVKSGDDVKIKQEPEESQSLILIERMSQPLQVHPRAFCGSGVFDDQPQSLIQSDQSKPPSSAYVSQKYLMIFKASSMELQMQDFETILKEKIQIARNRFPGESAAWQTWFAESMTWGFYFKNERFPGIAPPRLFPLWSTKEAATHKSPSCTGGKWVKYTDSRRPMVTGPNSTMVDSYRPSGSRIRTDRATHVAGDSYRPSSMSLNRSPRVSKSAGQQFSKSQNRSGSVDNSKVQQAAPNTYIPLERTMEHKAIALGIRREFFQYLQIKRDEVRAAHPDCSTQYRHWAADSMVWAKFFRKDPFPASEPKGSNCVELHSKRCPMSKAQKSHSPSVRTAQVLSKSQPFPTTEVVIQPQSTRMIQVTAAIPTLTPGRLDLNGNSPNARTADEDWENFANKFQATDVDRMMIEEAAKVEGTMRMVFDPESQEVISLETFARRIRVRMPDRLHSSESMSKRKLECEENGPVEKKTKT